MNISKRSDKGECKSLLEITPILQENQGSPYYLQLYQYIRDEIAQGRFPPGTRLPSIRNCAKHLRLSRNTIETAYQQLLAEGYLISKPRQGLFVTEIEGDFSKQTGIIHITPPQPSQAAPAKSVRYDFRNGEIDVEHFPLSVWRRLTHLSLSEEENQLLHYGDPQGEWGLRVEIANYLHQSRGVTCRPEQIVIGAGGQYLLGLLCQLLQSDVSSIAVEDPGYMGAKAVFQNHQMKLHPIPLEEDGLQLETLSHSGARVVYITPSHQFPCGMVLPIAKRIKLLQWAEANDGLIIEDDYDGEFRYYQKPIPSLQGLDRSGRVIYVGTFSKSLLPGIRMSYLILPDRLLDLYHQRFSVYEQTVSRIHQRTVQLFMEQGYWGRHIRKMRVLYQRKQEILVTSIQQELGDTVRLIGTDAGLHVLLEIQSQLSAEECITRAEELQVKVYSTSRLWLSPPPNQLPTIMLGYGALSEADIQEGIQRLAKAFK